MSRETYLDTVVDIHAAGADGLAYASLTRAQRVHVRSLKSDRYVAAFIGDEEVTLDTEGAVVCITTDGSTYVETLAASGLVMLPEAAPEPVAKPTKTVSKRKSSRRTTRKPKAVTVPANPDTVTPVKTTSPEAAAAALTVPKGTVNTKKVTTTTLEERVSATVIETLMGLGLVGASK